MSGSLLHRRNPTNRQLHLPNRRLIPQNRCQDLENDGRARRGILPRRKNTRRTNSPQEEELRRHFATDKRQRKLRRPRLPTTPPGRWKRGGDSTGILIGRGEVRLAEDIARPLLKLQLVTNDVQKLLDVEVECRKTCPNIGSGESIEAIRRIRYGRLLVSEEISPFEKRARGAIDAFRENLSWGNADHLGGTENNPLPS